MTLLSPLLQEYQKHLRSVPGEDASRLDETMQLLRHTQEMISLFGSRQPIASVEDEQIRKCKSFLKYLRQWKGQVENTELSEISEITDVTKTQNKRNKPVTSGTTKEQVSNKRNKPVTSGTSQEQANNKRNKPMTH